jgi:hypothetical protein
MVAATVAYVLEIDVFSTCQPCECDSEGVLHHCDVFAVAESLTMVDGLNVNAYVATLDLEGKGITKIHPGSFEGLWGVETLILAKSEIDRLAPGTFKGMDSIRTIDLDSKGISLIESHYFDSLALKYVSINGNPIERIQAVGKFKYGGGLELHSFEVMCRNDICTDWGENCCASDSWGESRGCSVEGYEPQSSEFADTYSWCPPEGNYECCAQDAGEIHHVVKIDGGLETCRFTDENSCPDGMDIWVPRSYAHAEAVVRLVGSRYTRLCGIYQPG